MRRAGSPEVGNKRRGRTRSEGVKTQNLATGADRTPGLVLGLMLLALSACASEEAPTAPGEDDGRGEDDSSFCAMPSADLMSILGPEQIPALTDPVFVDPAAPGAEPWTDDSRVIGLIVDGQPLAVPLGLMYHHEIVNLNRGDERLAVTYCPLTGTALTFDRSGLGDAGLGVSGILMRNNLVMYDRDPDAPSFFGQMTQDAVCGPRARRREPLPMVVSWEMRWDAWRALHPDTRVGVAHQRLIMTLYHEGRPAVAFWDRAAEAATAFYADLDGEELSFEPIPRGYRDDRTGTVWRLDGLGVEGPDAGRRLEPVVEAYVAFWFAWADFHPETVVREP